MLCKYPLVALLIACSACGGVEADLDTITEDAIFGGRSRWRSHDQADTWYRASGLLRSASGRISHAEDTDWFVFSASAGAAYTLRVDHGTLGSSDLLVRKGNGTVVAFRTDYHVVGRSNREAVVRWEAEESERVYVRVRSHAPHRRVRRRVDHRAHAVAQPELTGSYRLIKTVHAAAGDDHANDPLGATDIELPAEGTAVEAELEAAGDVDWFVFDVERDRHYAVEILAQGSTGPTPSLDVRGCLHDGTVFSGGRPPELVCSSLYVGNRRAIRYRATRNQRVLLAVKDRTGGFTGDYGLRVVPLHTGDDDHGDSNADATTIIDGDHLDGSFEVAGEKDWFVFDAVAGTTYSLRVNRASPWPWVYATPRAPRLDLQREDGTSLAQSSSYSGRNTARITWTARVTGPLFVVVSTRVEHKGGYRLHLDAVLHEGDDHSDDPSFATGLADHALGTIDREYDQDWFVVSTEPGRTYSVATELPSAIDGGLVDSELLVYGEDMISLLEWNDDHRAANGHASIATFTAQGHEVFVLVRSPGPRTGDYELTLTMN